MTTHIYPLDNGDRVLLTEDKDGCISAASGSEPAWSFRLWKGAVALSSFFERNAPTTIYESTIIELGNSVLFLFQFKYLLILTKGAGTGLVSLVAEKCGAHKTIATDMPHAIPLLRHNILINSQGVKIKAPHLVQECVPFCPSGHGLVQAEADCEEYMCSVCDLDIEENGRMQRCEECNFDVCNSCLESVEHGNLEALPTWYRVHLEDYNSKSVSVSESSDVNRLAVCAYDWSDESCLDTISKILRDSDGVSRGRVIVASDVTYNRSAVTLFFKAVSDVTKLYFDIDTECRNSAKTVQLIYLHYSREADTEMHMLNTLFDLMGTFPSPNSTSRSRYIDTSVQCQVFECSSLLPEAEEGSTAADKLGSDEILSKSFVFSEPKSLGESFAGRDIAFDCEGNVVKHDGGSRGNETVFIAAESASENSDSGSRIIGSGLMRVIVVNMHLAH